MLHGRRVLVVGINPSSARTDKICQSIKRLVGWADALGLQHYSFVNCIGHPGPYSHRDVEYEFLQECAKGYDKVLALGGFPSKALNRIGVEHFMLPHPSGLNRKLNDKQYEQDILEKCGEYLRA